MHITAVFLGDVTEMEILTQYGRTYSDPPERIRHSGRGLVIRDGKILLSYEKNTDVYMSPGGGRE